MGTSELIANFCWTSMDDFAASIADATDNCDTPSADCADAADAETADAAAAETAEAEMKAACSAL
jgi:hypothetical protein